MNLSCPSPFATGCRKPDSCLEALNKLYPDESSSKRHYECLGLDLTSLESVRSFANEVKAKNIPIQVLVNNGKRHYSGKTPPLRVIV